MCKINVDSPDSMSKSTEGVIEADIERQRQRDREGAAVRDAESCLGKALK